MHRSSYLRRFLLLLCLCVVLSAVGSFVISFYFAGGGSNTGPQLALMNARTAGRKLSMAYEAGILPEHDLRLQFNPVMNGDNAFWILYDGEMRVVSCTEAAEELASYLCLSDYGSVQLARGRETPVALELGGMPGGVLIEVESVGKGTLVSGVAYQNTASAAGDATLRLLITLPAMVLIVMTVGLLFTRTAARPAQRLIDAANRIKEGDFTDLPEDLPAETGDIAGAFSYLSAAVGDALNALQYEKETMSLLIEGMSEGILALDENGALLHCNTAARQLLGGEGSEGWNAVMTALKNGEANAEGKVNGGAGSVLQYTVSVLPGREGVSAGRMALIRDITEQERLERTRYDYVANISHELRTPLASIRGLGEGLRDGMVSREEDRERYYNIIVDEATRLSRLVNDLLELSGLQSNPAAFETEKVDLNDLIYGLEDLNRSLFEKAGLTFVRDLPEEPLPEVISSEDRLSEVMTILLDNARKYTPTGGTVTLGAEGAADGKNIRLYVRDTGIGMDEETRRMAFERFHRAEKSHSGKGSGLGLAIAREIMKKLGLEIRVESEPGKGSEFSFAIPVPGNE